MIDPIYVKQAKRACRERVFAVTDDSMGRAVASAMYRMNNSEIARCFLRLVAAQGTEAGTAETGTGSVHDGPVGNADAPEPHQHIREQE